MTSRELLYIKTIADEKSVTRAAQKLYLTQPSLSHCVSSIERQLGTRLFTRTSSGLVLRRKILSHGLRGAAHLRRV